MDRMLEHQMQTWANVKEETTPLQVTQHLQQSVTLLYLHLILFKGIIVSQRFNLLEVIHKLFQILNRGWCWMVGTILPPIKILLTCLEMQLLRLMKLINLLVLSRLRTKIYKCYIETKGLMVKQLAPKIKVIKCNKDIATT